MFREGVYRRYLEGEFIVYRRYLEGGVRRYLEREFIGDI